jgi:hypothetical protein
MHADAQKSSRSGLLYDVGSLTVAPIRARRESVMAVTFKTPVAKPKRVYTNTKPQAPIISLEEPGYIRNANFQALLGNLSKAAFYQRRKKGVVPPPDGHDPRPFWRTETVRAFLAGSK